MADSVPATSGSPDLAAVVLAAGEGRRLQPLSRVLPKVLCPVANRALVDRAIDGGAAAVDDVAVNVHHGREVLEPHLRARGDVHVSVEDAEGLGTAGAIGYLRPWLDGRGALVLNGDTWAPADLAGFVAGWDRRRVRILVVGDQPFGPRSAIVASLLPWSEVRRLEPVPSGLYEVCWRALAAADAIETVPHAGPWVDCGTPARYLAANRQAGALETGTTGGSVVHPTAVVAPGAVVDASVIGPGARIEGRVRRSVVWGGTTVARGEELVDSIRASRRVTVAVR
jgi:mannose-1-phosphate guanylyltransferase/MurNAc alpha-1-phosphate uridylyltransferase